MDDFIESGENVEESLLYNNSVSGDTSDIDNSGADPSESSDNVELIPLTIEDLQIGENVFIGAGVCGVGLIVSLGVIGLLRILRQA